MEYRTEIREFILKNLDIDDDYLSFSDNDNYFELGFVNSLFAMKLVTYIEQKYEIEIENKELDLKNFSTINNLMSLINKKVEPVGKIKEEKNEK